MYVVQIQNQTKYGNSTTPSPPTTTTQQNGRKQLTSTSTTTTTMTTDVFFLATLVAQLSLSHHQTGYPILLSTLSFFWAIPLPLPTPPSRKLLF
jgi:hypothetical protein